MATVQVVSKPASFHRAGRMFSSDTPTVLKVVKAPAKPEKIDEIDEKTLEVLKAEPKLVVSPYTPPPEKEEGKEKKGR